MLNGIHGTVLCALAITASVSSKQHVLEDHLIKEEANL
jgi:hypothetical protein